MQLADACSVLEVEGEEEVEEREEEEEEDKQEAVPSLQQQLELIQSQLLALSNLPVEAQATLESVTQQLARLVQANSPRPETKDEQVTLFTCSPTT